MTIESAIALERVMTEGDEWQSWRALLLDGSAPEQVPTIPGQSSLGDFSAASGRPSPGATAESLCHLLILGLGDSGPAVIAADWLEEARTPAQAWLDAPADVPVLDAPGGARVWATAAATCALLALGRDPGQRAIGLLRGEADHEGRFTGGPYPTFAAAGAYWLAEGPKTEMAEWALRWAREENEAWEPWDRATALTFWGAARIPGEHLTVEIFLESLRAEPAAEGYADDLELTLRTLELIAYFES